MMLVFKWLFKPCLTGFFLSVSLLLGTPALAVNAGSPQTSDAWHTIVDLRPLRVVGDTDRAMPGYWQQRKRAEAEQGISFARVLYPKPGKGERIGVGDAIRGAFTTTSPEVAYIAYKYFEGDPAINPNPYFSHKAPIAYSVQYNDAAIVVAQGQKPVGMFSLGALPWFLPKLCDVSESICPGNEYFGRLPDDSFSPYTYGFVRVPQLLPGATQFLAVGGRTAFWGRHTWRDHTGDWVGNIYYENYGLNIFSLIHGQVTLVASFPHAHEVYYCGMTDGALRNQVIAYRRDPGDPSRLQFRVQTYTAPCDMKKQAMDVPVKGPLKLIKTEIMTPASKVLGPLKPFPQSREQ
ncbi:MAG: hypothetical protein ACYCSH_02320 [Acidithiobacillus sp.]